jgi:hypothetical protein
MRSVLRPHDGPTFMIALIYVVAVFILKMRLRYI